MSSVYPLGLFKLLRALFTSPRNLALALASLWLHGKLTGKDNVRLAPNKKLVFYFPLAVYDVIARLAWTVNFAINAAPAYQPCGAPAWHDDKALAPGAVGDMAPAALGQLKQRLLAQADERFEEKEVVQLFDSLKEANTDLLIEKTWKGHVVRSGSVLDLAEWALVRPLTMLGFGWGKRYRSRHVGDPLLLNFMEKVYVPLPAWGNVSMLNVRRYVFVSLSSRDLSRALQQQQQQQR